MTALGVTPAPDETAARIDRPPAASRVFILAEIGAGDVAAVMQSLKASLPAGTRLQTRITAQAEDPVSAGPSSTLNTRQWEIFALLAEGLTNKQIGRRLSLSHFTVRNHVCHILHAVGAGTRREAAQTFILWAGASSGCAEPSA